MVKGKKEGVRKWLVRVIAGGKFQPLGISGDKSVTYKLVRVTSCHELYISEMPDGWWRAS